METKKEKIIIGILISLTCLLWFINQWLSNQLYYETPQYVKNQQEIQQLKRINNQLNLKLLHLESYTYIEQQAIKEGFVPMRFTAP